MKFVAINLAFLTLFASCASSTVFRTLPGEAKLYLNDEYVGETPYNHEDTKIMGSRTSVRIEKEGYETLYTNITRNEEADIGAIIGGIFFLFPFLWTMGYKSSHQYELVPMESEKNTVGNSMGAFEPNTLTDEQYDQLVKLKDLLDREIISQSEFEKRKAKILNH
ncbi:PEGA domain-containing protein [Membranihabitans maritimus]|uniref:PEGA domain-containing protein n=1 Tax=Membranihabitans maritimus TaxID=2904244 RepID=UPI001F34D1CF|nr:PEGA domain-containing protein [Membranihabitans maritimus]